MPLINLLPAELKSALDSGEVAVIDVREPNEFALERIAGAENYPLSMFAPEDLPQGKTLVLSCAGGVRSVRAFDLCRAAGIDVTRHLAGGLNAWKAAGLPTER